MRPTRFHDSSHSPESGDSVPRWSGWSGVDSGKLRWTCLLPPSPPTASCTFPWLRAPSAKTHWYTAGLGPYASMRFPQGGRGADPAGCAPLVHPDLVSRTHFPHDSTSLAHSSEEGYLLSGVRHHMAPASRSMEPPRVAPGPADLSGLAPAVVETIIQAGAPSTRQTYAQKLSLFSNWCSSRRENPWRCTIGVVLSFLQERLERRLSPSTLKVYVAAIVPFFSSRSVPRTVNPGGIFQAPPAVRLSKAVWRQAQYWC